MAVPPITGMLRKRIFLDLSVALGLGTVGAYGYWYGLHLPNVRRREEYYLKLEKQRAAAAAGEA